jgi:methyl-accepting chemotaxis protein
MEEIVQSIERVDALVGEISSATQEQSSGIEEVNHALSQMEKITQQNGALAEQSAAAVESLEEQSRMLVRTVSVFKLNGAGAGPLALDGPEGSPALEGPDRQALSKPRKIGVRHRLTN